MEISLQAVGVTLAFIFEVVKESTAKNSRHGESLQVRHFNPLRSSENLFSPFLELVLLLLLLSA